MVLEAGRYVVAVSGGVDSVVLLDQLAARPGLDLVVAHFDHGIRDDSADDERFVRGLAARYGLDYESKREELGQDASEASARDRRYRFLRDIAADRDARIVTAHHADDVIETIAINIVRGTGWRGLAVLDGDVLRPLIGYTKQQLIEYAMDHDLEWMQDSTNSSDQYLRNRIRKNLVTLDDTARVKLHDLYKNQLDKKAEIKDEVQRLLPTEPYDRYFFICCGDEVAKELLRAVTNHRLTGPQLERSLHAIKTLRNGAIYQAGDGVEFIFTTRQFSVKLVK